MVPKSKMARVASALLLLAFSARIAAAACPPGQELKAECFQWGHECAVAWIKTCYCCVNAE